MKEVSEFNFSITNLIIEEILLNPKILLDRLNSTDDILYLKDYILDGLSNKDGGPMINNLQIKSLSYKSSINKGKFRLTFDIERQYCCSDIQSTNSDYIDFDFQIKAQELKVQAKYLAWEVND